MKIFKKILIVLAILILIPLIAALFMEKEYTVERKVTIARSEADVFNYIKYLKNQDEFSKWASMDPKMIKSYRGTDGTVGFVSAWKSDMDDVGSGEQEIKKIQENERIDFELRFLEPFESNAAAYMTTDEQAADQTQVTWGFAGETPYPWNFMTAFMDMDEMIGADLETGLNNLKTKLEK